MAEVELDLARFYSIHTHTHTQKEELTQSVRKERKCSRWTALTCRRWGARAVIEAPGPAHLVFFRGSWATVGWDWSWSAFPSPVTAVPLSCSPLLLCARQCGYVGACESVGVRDRDRHRSGAPECNREGKIKAGGDVHDSPWWWDFVTCFQTLGCAAP